MKNESTERPDGRIRCFFLSRIFSPNRFISATEKKQRKYKCLIFIFLTGYVWPATAVDNLLPESVAARGSGLRGVAESPEANPAVCGLLVRKTGVLSYFNRFLMKETGTVQAAFFRPGPVLGSGVSAAIFGSGLYRDHRFTISLSKRIRERWSAGLSLNYRFLHLSGIEEKPACLSAAFGACFRPDERWSFGVVCRNGPAVPIGGAFREMTGFSVAAGVSWRFLPAFVLAGEWEAGRDLPFQGGIGCRYRLSPVWTVRTGVHTEPLTPYAGLGCTWGAVSCDLVACYHPVLGAGVGMSLSCSFF